MHLAKRFCELWDRAFTYVMRILLRVGSQPHVQGHLTEVPHVDPTRSGRTWVSAAGQH